MYLQFREYEELTSISVSTSNYLPIYLHLSDLTTSKNSLSIHSNWIMTSLHHHSHHCHYFHHPHTTYDRKIMMQEMDIAKSERKKITSWSSLSFPCVSSAWLTSSVVIWWHTTAPSPLPLQRCSMGERTPRGSVLGLLLAMYRHTVRTSKQSEESIKSLVLNKERKKMLTCLRKNDKKKQRLTSLRKNKEEV